MIDPPFIRACLLAAAVPASLWTLAPALAQVGPAGASVGLPADPFASNYPSAPPPRGVDPGAFDEDGPRPSRRRRVRRPVEAAPRGLRPPADIPSR